MYQVTNLTANVLRVGTSLTLTPGETIYLTATPSSGPDGLALANLIATGKVSVTDIGSKAATPSDLVYDNTGLLFSPSSCGQAFAYDSNGNLTTITATDPQTSYVRVQTLTYTNSQLTAQSAWVKQ